ncbi:MAG: AAA family ATPase [Candidatus Aenigmarchaeota archaeon]|nr:AAA family ATPase [Candidatus Aenigmarchaeota archaeon]
MLLKSIRLKNIRSYMDEKIEFPLGTSLLSGDIGSGKSTILMALDFALFGIRKGELSGSDLLRHGKNEGSIELELAVDSKNMKIKRGLKRGNSISQENCILTVNGLSESLTSLELKAKILDLLGYPQELLKKNKPIFRYTVYTPQEEMKRILTDAENRLEILRKIFGIDKYGVIRSNARLFLTELRSMKRELEAYARDLEIKKQEKDGLQTLLASIAGQLSEAKNRLATINMRYEEKAKIIDQLKKELNEFRKIQLAMAKKESELKAHKSKAEDLALELSNIDTKIQFNINLVEEPLNSDINSVIDAIKMLETDRDGMLKNIAVLDAETDKLSAIYSKGVCSFCGQAVTDPASFKQHLDERKGKRGEILAGIKQADEQLASLKDRKSGLEKFHAIKKTVEDLKRWKTDKQEDLSRTTLSMAEAENMYSQLKTEYQKYENTEAMSMAAEKELVTIQKEKTEVEKSISRLEQQKEDIELRLVVLEKEIIEKEDARKKIGKINSLLAWFDNFILLMENIEKHVLLTVQREFDQYFQHWFSILMGDALAVRIDESFSPVIEQNSYETSFENLSGGEKTSVSLAYRLALNKVINTLIAGIRTKDLLILDEPTDGFSTDQLDRVRDVVNALDLKQIILVSHEPKIETYVQNVLKVYKEDHVSRVVTQ